MTPAAPMDGEGQGQGIVTAVDVEPVGGRGHHGGGGGHVAGGVLHGHDGGTSRASSRVSSGPIRRPDRTGMS